MRIPACPRSLLHRLVEIRGHARELPPQIEDLLPDYKLWLNHGELVGRLQAGLQDVGEELCFAKHPLRWLGQGVLTRTVRWKRCPPTWTGRRNSSTPLRTPGIVGLPESSGTLRGDSRPAGFRGARPPAGRAQPAQPADAQPAARNSTHWSPSSMTGRACSNTREKSRGLERAAVARRHPERAGSGRSFEKSIFASCNRPSGD